MAQNQTLATLGGLGVACCVVVEVVAFQTTLMAAVAAGQQQQHRERSFDLADDDVGRETTMKDFFYKCRRPYSVEGTSGLCCLFAGLFINERAAATGDGKARVNGKIRKKKHSKIKLDSQILAVISCPQLLEILLFFALFKV